MEKLILTQKELSKLEVINMVQGGQYTQIEGAKILGISGRHMRRLIRSYRQNGAKGLIPKSRGRPSNNKLSSSLIEDATELIKSKYIGFGPTLVTEKLVDKHQMRISVESVRKLMIREELWRPKRKRQPQIHQMRHRRSSFGELIQIDGSPHAWFEDRAPKCCLIAFIDDATNTVTGAQFFPSETTQAYFEVLREHLEKYGRPECFYSDRNSIFRLNQVKISYKGSGLTQFGRALEELGVNLICANSPQAKGRVERLFKTLQDRLVKEMRLAGINSIEKGNVFLKSYLITHNARFSVQPTAYENKHKEVLESFNLENILCMKDRRKLSKNLELSIDGHILQIQTERPTYAMRGAQVEIIKRPGEKFLVQYKGLVLPYKEIETRRPMGFVVDSKTLNYAQDVGKICG